MSRSGGVTARGLVVLAIVLIGLVIAAAALAHVGGGHGVTRL